MLKNFLHRQSKVMNSRRYKRFRADFLVKYQVDRKGETYITNARDISAGGLRLWLDKPISESSILNVSVYLPPLQRTVDALAQVLRVRSAKRDLFFDVAVSFLDLKQEDREAINKFSENLSRDRGTQFLIDHANIVVRRQQK